LPVSPATEITNPAYNGEILARASLQGRGDEDRTIPWEVAEAHKFYVLRLTP